MKTLRLKYAVRHIFRYKVVKGHGKVCGRNDLLNLLCGKRGDGKVAGRLQLVYAVGEI